MGVKSERSKFFRFITAPLPKGSCHEVTEGFVLALCGRLKSLHHASRGPPPFRQGRHYGRKIGSDRVYACHKAAKPQTRKRLVAIQRRYEGVYNRIADERVNFFGKRSGSVYCELLIFSENRKRSCLRLPRRLRSYNGILSGYFGFIGLAAYAHGVFFARFDAV